MQPTDPSTLQPKEADVNIARQAGFLSDKGKHDND
jgi:hypothetical protein